MHPWDGNETGTTTHVEYLNWGIYLTQVTTKCSDRVRNLMKLKTTIDSKG